MDTTNFLYGYWMRQVVAHSLPTSPACMHTSSRFLQCERPRKRHRKAQSESERRTLPNPALLWQEHNSCEEGKAETPVPLRGLLSSETVIIRLPARHPARLNSQEGVLLGSLLGHPQLLEGKRASPWTCISQDVWWLLAKGFLSD